MTYDTKQHERHTTMDEQVNEKAATGFTKTIWVSKLDAFKDKIVHLNRILAKNSKPPLKVSYTNFRRIPVEFEFHMKGDAYRNDLIETRYVEVCDAVCMGLTEVKKDDKTYTYLGSVSCGEGGRQVFVKDETFKDYFMDKFREGMCDHCHTKRMNRKAYHLFATDDGKVLQIGNTCAKEYFGISSDAFLNVQMNTFIVSYEGDECDFGYEKGSMAVSFNDIYRILDFLTRGFTKWVKKDAMFDINLPLYENPTVMGIDTILAECENGTCKVELGMNPQILTYEECVAYWEKQSNDTTFAFNCYNAIKSGYATKRTMGTFAYAIFGAVNAKVKEIIKAKAAKVAVPCPFKEGERVDVKGEILTVKFYEVQNEYDWRGGYMTMCSINLKAENGTLYHFSTSSTTFDDAKAGDRIEMRGTVGKTKEFDGLDYTKLLRPKCKKVEGAKEVA